MDGIATRPHVLIITVTDGEREYAIDCPGLTPDCQMWSECETCWPPNASPPRDTAEFDEQMWDTDGMAHGVQHKRFSWGWCVPGDRCFARDNNHLPSAADYLADRYNLPPGRYEVDFEAEDETDLLLTLVEDRPPVSTAAMVAGAAALDRAFSGIGDALRVARGDQS